jgi:formylglycine-generating enzyme required for sulfatase activity
MSRIFVSHSSVDNFEAVAVRDWLASEGWSDVFLDLDPERGIAAGERWERALHKAATRCEAVIFLVSRNWLGSGWCLKEYALARGLNKKLFAVIIEPGKTIADLPPELQGTWQVVDLTGGQDMRIHRTVLPGSHTEKHVAFSEDGLRRLKRGLEKAGLDPRFFAWPPESDPERSPYRGLKPIESVDAGIFFGRDAPIIEAIDGLRGLRAATAPRVLVILGASGAGKSSFLRAGLLPRLARNDSQFLPLPAIRPERAALTGESGLVSSLEAALAARGMNLPRAEIRSAVLGGIKSVRPLLQRLVDKAFAETLSEDNGGKPPTLVLAIDQAEELFIGEGLGEGATLLGLVRDLVEDPPAIIVLFTIRSDSYDRLQTAKFLEDVRQQTLPLSPMPRGAYQTVVEGPAARLSETSHKLAIEPRLTQRLLEDIEKGGGSDALPLLAFTMEQLYIDYGRASGELKLENYEAFGGLKGAIDAAVERAFLRADADAYIPRARKSREARLRQGLIPWLASVDPDTKSPRRNIARQADIPEDARPLINFLVEERLLTTDTVAEKDSKTGIERRIVTIEPAHEALLRQWTLLQGWLTEDLGLLITLEGIKRAAGEWDAHHRSESWLAHRGQRLAEAHALEARPDLAARLDAIDRVYLATCRKAEALASGRARRVGAIIYLLLVGIIAGLVGWINQSFFKQQLNWWMVMRPYAVANVWPYVLSADAQRALKPLAPFRECAKDCPTMIVIPTGEFIVGSPPTEPDRSDNEEPQHKVTIATPFAVSEYDVTFDDWDACVSVGACPAASDGDYGRGTRPVINVSWNDAQQYAAWLSEMTGQPYRLLTEAEWEYAARAGTTTAYYWGDEIGKGNASCDGCGSAWDNLSTSPVGSFPPNAFHLYDMAGDVWQWVEDCYHSNYDGAPTDGSAWRTGDCSSRVIRGASWDYRPKGLRSAVRAKQFVDYRDYYLGFRVARTLTVGVASGNGKLDRTDAAPKITHNLAGTARKPPQQAGHPAASPADCDPAIPPTDRGGRTGFAGRGGGALRRTPGPPKQSPAVTVLSAFIGARAPPFISAT